MTEPALFFFMALLGTMGGLFSERFRPSGRIAVALPLVAGAALYSAIGRA